MVLPPYPTYIYIYMWFRHYGLHDHLLSDLDGPHFLIVTDQLLLFSTLVAVR